jgi:secreted PhoX family phosphatase
MTSPAKKIISLICFLLASSSIYAIIPIDSLRIPLSDFTSLAPGSQDASIHIPAGFSFQTITQQGEAMSDGNTFPPSFDFTGYVPINGSGENGHLSINSENFPGGVSIMDIAFNSGTRRWSKNNSKKVDFSGVIGTVANCSGTVTPWNTVITCEEYVSNTDLNSDGYIDTGWAIEIDPVTKTVINNQKLWALGNFKHENLCIHQNERTAYQGVDDGTGYLYKFVADAAQDLNAGKLYVYVGSKNGSGTWELINNTTVAERNSVLSQSATKGATVFVGVEDVEINPINSWVYLAVKSENKVYRFQDSDPLTGTTVLQFETFVGGMNYDLKTSNGTVSTPWGYGNDNLAFDNNGTLWVLQDGDNNFLWVVGKDHTQANPDVRIFMKTPAGSEPTGITFSPDNRFLFMSIQHPSGSNNSTSQNDVNGLATTFDRDASIIIARDENWGLTPCPNGLSINQNPNSGYFQSSTDMQSSAAMNATTIIDYRAVKSVKLMPGFSTGIGTIFRAKIGGCL